MKKRRVLIVLAMWLAAVAVLAALVVRRERDEAAARAITEISVEHTPCFGPCPVYKVILRRDGTATWIGQKNTDKIGTYTADIYGFDRLARAVQSRGFFRLRSHYDANFTDAASVITTVVQNGRRKDVSNYGGAGPQELWEIETLVDGMLDGAQWHKVNGNTAYPAAH